MRLKETIANDEPRLGVFRYHRYHCYLLFLSVKAPNYHEN